MQTRLPLLLVLLVTVWLTWGGSLTWSGSLTWGGSAAAQVPPSAPPVARRPKATSFVALVKRPSGDRGLLISYPWKIHRRPSVEVRLVTGKDAPASDLRPLWFLSEYMKGAVKVTLYDCEDEAASGPVREPLVQKKVEFEILGSRNSLGKPSVCVVHRLAPDEPPPGQPSPEEPPPDEPPPDVTAVYCLLPAWAINKRLLQLDLPREDFAKPGKIHVWFLRDETILWKETLDWPGRAKRKTTKQQ